MPMLLRRFLVLFIWLLYPCGLVAAPRVDLPKGVPDSHICILSGTNMASALLKHDSIEGEFTLETPFGTSPKVYFGESAGVAYYHIPMHGYEGIDPTQPDAGVNALLRTWWTLYHLGVTEVLGGATAGWINPAYAMGDWILPEDFIDWNIERPRNIAYRIMGEEAAFILPRVNPAVDPELLAILKQACEAAAPEVNTFTGAVLAQAAGGRFETPAEIRMMQLSGCDLVSMSVGSEIAYARQLGMNYACFVGIVNPAEGLGPWNWDTLTTLYPSMHKQSVEIYLKALPKIAALQGQPRVGDELRIHPEFDSPEESE
ncbi:MAG: hypothetical protein ACFBZ8_03080 [Opitutales bacterium]